MMKGLVLNDLILIRKSLAWSYLFPIVVIVMAGMGDVSMLLTGMPMVVLFLANSLVVGLFSREEASGWRVALRSLPVTAFGVVSSRFFVAAMSLAATCVVVGLAELAIAAAMGIGFDYVLAGSAMGLWLIAAYDSFLFPFFYRFGPSKANIATITLVGLIILAMYAIQRWGFALDSAFLMPLPAFVAGAGVLLAVLVAISMFVSSKIVSADFSFRHYFHPTGR
ncbi:MAG: ABC-2 transporter permease [Slackia sp.]|nr:ABC-2 transporter permease [Slackia sp.]